MIALLMVLVFVATFMAAAIAVVLAAAAQRGQPGLLDETPMLLREEPLSTVPFWRRFLDWLNFTGYLKHRLDEAGLRWSVGRVTLSMLLLAALSFAVFSDVAWAPPGAAFVAAWIGGSIPFWVIRWIRTRRLRKMESQFPDALDSLARALRAGHALAGAIAMLASEIPAPLGPEFHRSAEEHNLGLPWDATLQNLAKRVPIVEVRLFVAAVLVQMHTGGKLTEVLERLAESVRESGALRGEVKAISAQGRLTGTILTALPILIGIAMYLTNPAYITLLFVDPTGNLLAWCAVGCLILGHFVIRQIVDIKAPQ